MKRFFGVALMVALLSIPSFAAKNSGSVNIADAVTVGSTQLPPAEYKVTWTGEGSNVQVTLAHGKTTVTVPAKLVEQNNGGQSILTNSKNGAAVVEAINLNKVTLVLTSSPATGQ